MLVADDIERVLETGPDVRSIPGDSKYYGRVGISVGVAERHTPPLCPKP